MPRKARIDAPGALHHIIVRGIERGIIFEDDWDRNRFVDRLGGIVEETGTRCLAWALISNHFHLLLKTGRVPVATVMRRLLTGYAVNFNRRHRRYGHLFQNRYKIRMEIRVETGSGLDLHSYYKHFSTPVAGLLIVPLSPSGALSPITKTFRHASLSRPNSRRT